MLNPLSDVPRRIARASDNDAQPEQRTILAPPVDRVRLEALRYAVNEESAQYMAVMRTFTGGLSGLLSDRSAAEVAATLAEEGIGLDRRRQTPDCPISLNTGTSPAAPARPRPGACVTTCRTAPAIS
jgi:hypothetical protein